MTDKEHAPRRSLVREGLQGLDGLRSRAQGTRDKSGGQLDAGTGKPAHSQAAKNAAIATFKPGSRNHRDCGIYIGAVIDSGLRRRSKADPQRRLPSARHD